MRTAVCTLSGGFDSTAALFRCIEEYPTHAVFIDYGQPYLEQEREGVNYIASLLQDHPNLLGVRTMKVDIATPDPANPYFPHRNLIIGSMVANLGVTLGAPVLAFGSKSLVHRPEDPVSYLDSTQGFYDDLEDLLAGITEKGQPTLCIELPVVGWTKEQVLVYLRKQGVDLRRLWNCYERGKLPCGHCHHCVETLPLVERLVNS